jgi:hypothetical protein
MFSLMLSIIFSYGYGYVMHYRYWKISIPATHEKEIEVIQGILKANIDNMVKSHDYSELKKVFAPVDGKIYIEAIKNGEIVYNNRERKYKINFFREDTYINTPYGTLIIRIATYKPPIWNFQFSQWLKPGNWGSWFSSKFDFITYSFIAFFSIILLGLFAFAMWYKARHESGLLKEILEELEVEQKKEG